LEAKLSGNAIVFPNVENAILENNLYGVDINEESVEIAKLALWLRTAKPQRKLNSLNNNIKCGNSLISDPEVAGEKAFDWHKEFPQVFEKGGFDVVIGNPPYVNMVNIGNQFERLYYQKNYCTVKNKSDLYSIFIERGYGILSQNGLLGYIFPNSWLGTESFSKLREFLVQKTKIIELVKLPNDVFADAVVTPLIMIFKKENVVEHSILLKQYKNNVYTEIANTLLYSRIKKDNSFTFSFSSQIEIKIKTILLQDIAKFSLGIKTSDDKRFIFPSKIDDDCYPILRGRNISKYYFENPKEWIWYKPELITEKVGGRPRILDNFLHEKIYIQDIAKTIIACYCDKSYLSNDTLNLIYHIKEPYLFKTILCILNSKLINSWFNSEYQEGLHIKINQLQTIPIPIMSEIQQQPFIALADKMLSLNSELQIKRQRFLKRLSDNFTNIKITGALERFEKLEFKQFLAELAKQKITLSLKQQDEWEEYFNEYQTECRNFVNQINATDKEIDRMVYALYGLTEEEVDIIDNQ